MKTIKKNFVQLFYLLIVLSLYSVLFCSYQGIQKNYKSEVIQAWEIRINGNADSAKVLLEQILLKDSTCAIAWYELARTEQHMSNGDMQNLMTHLEAAKRNIDNALTYSPENTAYLYFKADLQSLFMYVDLKMGNESEQDYLKQIEETYLTLLKIDPECHEAKLSLVELYAFMPIEMGGDSAKAEQYARELEAEDLVCGAKAREILMPEDDDYVAYWSKLIDENIDNPDLIEAQGRIYLFENDIEKARANFKKVIQLDDSKNYLYLDLGRYYMMQAMQGQMAVDTAVPLIMAEFEIYMESKPEPPNYMKAWTIGQMAMLNMRTGNEEEGQKLLDEALKLDKYFSRAFGLPGELLFVSPDVVLYEFGYLSRPF